MKKFILISLTLFNLSALADNLPSDIVIIHMPDGTTKTCMRMGSNIIDCR